jgi:hypothetical protein
MFALICGIRQRKVGLSIILGRQPCGALQGTQRFLFQHSERVGHLASSLVSCCRKPLTRELRSVHVSNWNRYMSLALLRVVLICWDDGEKTVQAKAIRRTTYSRNRSGSARPDTHARAQARTRRQSILCDACNKMKHWGYRDARLDPKSLFLPSEQQESILSIARFTIVTPLQP